MSAYLDALLIYITISHFIHVIYITLSCTRLSVHWGADSAAGAGGVVGVPGAGRAGQADRQGRPERHGRPHKLSTDIYILSILYLKFR